MCGATGAQNQIQAGQQSLFNNMVGQAQQVFGNSSQVFNDLMSTYSPIVAAGPNQQGYSPTELASMNSQAITNAGQQYKNQKEALGDQQAAYGGGTANLPGGSNLARQTSLAENTGNLTAASLNQITQNNYATGRANYWQAAQGLAGAPSVFNPATSAASSAVGAGAQAANTANQIASQSNSWQQLVGGALGAVAGAATGGLTNSLGGGVTSTGSDSGPSGAPGAANYGTDDDTPATPSNTNTGMFFG